MKNSTKLQSVIQLLEDGEKKVALAAKNLNPFLTYIKFVLTDDQTNGNFERIPQSEFANLIATGIYMPIKMAKGRIEPGHNEAEPVGVIVGLKHVENRVVGTAVLWDEERESDIALIKQRYAEGEEINLSWELRHADSEYHEDTGVTDLLGCILLASTIVDRPAYMGRTPVTEVEASERENTEDDSEMETKLEELQARIAELEAQLADRDAKIAELQESQLSDETKAELDELRQFKAEKVAEQERIEKMSALAEKFSQAEVQIEENYIEENADMLLGLPEDALNFLISNLPKKESGLDEGDDTDGGDDEDKKVASQIPNLRDKKPDHDEDKLSVSELAKAYKSAK